MLEDKLPKAEWKRYQAFTKDIGLDGEPWIQLIRPKVTSALAPPPPSPRKNSGQPGSASSEVPVQGPPSNGGDATGNQPFLPENASARDLLQAAVGQISSGDLNGATATLDKVKAKNPNEQYLWAGYGAIAVAQKKYDDAKADFTKELAAYPENAGAVAALAGVGTASGTRQERGIPSRAILTAIPKMCGSPYIWLLSKPLRTTMRVRSKLLRPPLIVIPTTVPSVSASARRS